MCTADSPHPLPSEPGAAAGVCGWQRDWHWCAPLAAQHMTVLFLQCRCRKCWGTACSSVAFAAWFSAATARHHHCRLLHLPACCSAGQVGQQQRRTGQRPGHPPPAAAAAGERCHRQCAGGGPCAAPRVQHLCRAPAGVVWCGLHYICCSFLFFVMTFCTHVLCIQSHMSVLSCAVLCCAGPECAAAGLQSRPQNSDGWQAAGAVCTRAGEAAAWADTGLA